MPPVVRIDIAHTIQTAIAPVFLLTGVAAILGVLSNRLGRIIDRARLLEDRLLHAAGHDADVMHEELHILSRRARLIYRAIALGTTCALLVCIVIATLFGAALFDMTITKVIAAFFIAAMVALIGALVIFLREVFFATASLRIGSQR
ncbi:MAG TPA: DUF2721 domain-containing protein [Thermoanaerobaculia bacterium]|nr:DUF2721 domain-containing protein [Thermoanaerobaculia bacterium]